MRKITRVCLYLWLFLSLPAMQAQVNIRLLKPQLPIFFPASSLQNEVEAVGEIDAATPISKISIAMFQSHPEKIKPCLASFYFEEGSGKKRALFKSLIQVKPLQSKLIVAVELESRKNFEKFFHLPTAYTNAGYEEFQELVKKDIHKDAIRSLRFSMDSKYLVSAGDDRTIQILNPRTLQVIKSWKAHAGYVRRAIMTSDNQRILSCSDDKTVKIWNAATGEVLHVFKEHENPVHALAISPDEKYLASASEKIRVWDLEQNKLVFTSEDNAGQFHTIAYSPDGRYLFSGDDNHKIIVWDMGAKSKLYTRTQAHFGDVVAIAVDPNMRFLFSGGSKCKIRLWHLLLNPLQAKWADESHLMWETRLCLIKDRNKDLVRAALAPKVPGTTKENMFRAPVFTPTKTEDNSIKWEKPYSSFELDGESLAGLEVNGSGEFVMIATEAGEMRIHETHTAIERYCAFFNRVIQSGTFAHDGSMVALGEISGRIWIYGLKAEE